MGDMKNRRRTYDLTARAARAEATKSRIRSAAMTLYCERPIDEFTLDEVAARADVSVRTVLRCYGSKEDLFYAALDELTVGGTPMRPTPPGDVTAAIGAIFDIYEAIGDVVMRRLADEHRHPRLKPLLELGREGHRKAVEIAFAPQLKQRQGTARAQLLHILLVATDVYVWKLLRRDMALGRAAAEAIVRKMITAVIEGGKANGADSLVELVGRRQPAS